MSRQASPSPSRRIHQHNNESSSSSPKQTKWLERTTQTILNTPVGQLRNHSTTNSNLRPILKSWAQTCSKHGAKMANRILHRLLEEEDYYDQLHQNNNNTNNTNTNGGFLVSTAIYCSVIDAHAKSGRGAVEAEGILKLMLHKYSNEGKHHAKPNTVAFNATLDAWSKMPMDNTNNSNNNNNNNTKYNAAERAEELLNWMHLTPYAEPDTISYNAVLVCLTRAGLASRAEALHNVMEKLHRNNNNGNISLRPNTHTLTTVCNAWARSGARGAAQRAAQILERMERDYLTSTAAAAAEHLKPNVKTYTCVMDAWAKSMEEDAPQQAEAVLNRMAEGMALIHQHHPQGVRRVLQVEPNVQSYAAVLDAWAKSRYWDKASRAGHILMRMKQRYERTGHEASRPNVFCYTAVINAAAFCCSSTTTSMSCGSTGSSVSNNSSGSVEDNKEAALNIAFATLNDLQTGPYGPPNHVTYTTFLKACANLMRMHTAEDRIRRRDIVQHVFHVACENGQVSRNLFAQYRRLMVEHQHHPDDDAAAVVAVPYGCVGDVPGSWCRNVRERQYAAGKNHTNNKHKHHHRRRVSPSSSPNRMHAPAHHGGVSSSSNGASMVQMPSAAAAAAVMMVTPPGSPDHSSISAPSPSLLPSPSSPPLSVQRHRRASAVSMESEGGNSSSNSNTMMWEWGHVRDDLIVHG